MSYNITELVLGYHDYHNRRNYHHYRNLDDQNTEMCCFNFGGVKVKMPVTTDENEIKEMTFDEFLATCRTDDDIRAYIDALYFGSKTTQYLFEGLYRDYPDLQSGRTVVCEVLSQNELVAMIVADIFELIGLDF